VCTSSCSTLALNYAVLTGEDKEGTGNNAAQHNSPDGAVPGKTTTVSAAALGLQTNAGTFQMMDGFPTNLQFVATQGLRYHLPEDAIIPSEYRELKRWARAWRPATVTDLRRRSRLMFKPRGEQMDRAFSYAQGTDKDVLRIRAAETKCTVCYHRRLTLFNMPASHAFICGDSWAVNLDERCHDDEGPSLHTSRCNADCKHWRYACFDPDSKRGKFVYG
jgi:hypothetical protein